MGMIRKYRVFYYDGSIVKLLGHHSITGAFVYHVNERQKYKMCVTYGNISKEEEEARNRYISRIETDAIMKRRGQKLLGS